MNKRRLNFLNHKRKFSKINRQTNNKKKSYFKLKKINKKIMNKDRDTKMIQLEKIDKRDNTNEDIDEIVICNIQNLQTIKKKSKVPWLNEKTNEYTGQVKLHFEILDFYDCLKLRTDEDILRLRTFKLFKKMIMKEWPNWKVKAYGSFPLGITLPDSDIDVVVFKNANFDINKITTSAFDSEMSGIDQLSAIYNCIKNNNFSDESRLVDAKVPIIRLKCRETQIRMDISVNQENGVKAMKFFQNVLTKNPQIVPIIILLKFVLRQRNLNETFTGGLSSYLLLSLIYAYFQYLNRQRIIEQFTNLGAILMGFLQFYSIFEYDKYGISIRNEGKFFDKNDSNYPYNPNLCFENFQDPHIDIGRGAFLFNRVVILFKEILAKLKKTRSDSVSYLETFINVTKELRLRSKFIESGNA